MVKVRRKLVMMLLLILLPVISGCWDVEEINQRGVANAVFFDRGSNSRYKMGVVLGIPGTEIPPIVGTYQQFKTRHFVITGEGDSMVEAWAEIQANTVRNIFFGQIRAIILSEELARENINDVLDFIGRFPLVPPNTNVLIAKEDPEELMDMPNEPNLTPGSYIDFYFQSPFKRSLAIPMDLWRVNAMVDRETDDPFIPLIEEAQQNYLIHGAALFSQNRMVGELSREETQILALVRGTDVGYLTVPLGENRHAAFANVRSQARITPNLLSGAAPRFDLSVDVRGTLTESFPHREIGWQQKWEIERAAAGIMQRDIENLIEKLQRLNTDPVGFGGKLRINHPREWVDLDWYQIYPAAEIRVKTNFTIKETGLFR